MASTVVILGAGSAEDRILPGVAREFGWAVECVPDIEALGKIGPQCQIVAVLFQLDPSGMFPAGVIDAMRAAAPGARPIVCNRFADCTSWPEMAGAGVFHFLRIPFAAPEVRQSFGFVWAAQGSRNRSWGDRSPGSAESHSRS